MLFSQNDFEKAVDFGARGASDFTLHKDEFRKQQFLSRFRKLIVRYEDDPMTPMTLSTWILWNRPTIEQSLNDYKQHFKFS